MKLDINENNLILDIKNKYYLDIKLSYPVFPEKGNAKLDSKTKKLKITLIIDQTKINKQTANVEQNSDINEKNDELDNNVNNEIEEIKPKPEETLNEVDENSPKIIENQNENNGLLEFHEKNHYLKLSPEKKMNSEIVETSDKKLIEEIISEKQPDENFKEEEEDKILNQKLKIPSILEYKTQENSEKFFIIIHIPNYLKAFCQFRLNDQEVNINFN